MIVADVRVFERDAFMHLNVSIKKCVLEREKKIFVRITNFDHRCTYRHYYLCFF